MCPSMRVACAVVAEAAEADQAVRGALAARATSGRVSSPSRLLASILDATCTNFGVDRTR